MNVHQRNFYDNSPSDQNDSDDNILVAKCNAHKPKKKSTTNLTALRKYQDNNLWTSRYIITYI